jgi:replication factor C subunit 2/4
MCEGFSVTQLLVQLHDRFVTNKDDLNDDQKATICEQVAINEARLLDGANEYLQLMDLAVVIMKALN